MTAALPSRVHRSGPGERGGPPILETVTWRFGDDHGYRHSHAGVSALYSSVAPTRCGRRSPIPPTSRASTSALGTEPSDFAIGSRIKSWSPDRSQLWTDNEVLEYDPPRRFAHTWRSLYDPETATEPESRVTWEVEAMPEGYARLTLVHDRLDGSPKTAASVRGWSYILSSLKTLLETGEPLPPPSL